MPATRGRSAAIDVVRVFALVAIIFGHVYAAPGLTRDLLYAWHVPVFFFLAGWLWKPGRPMGAEVEVRLRSLLVPYVAWLALVGVVWFAVSGTTFLHAAHELALGGQHIRRPFSAFWYVTAFVALCLLRRALEAFGDATVTTIAVVLWFGSYAFPGWLAGTPESIGMALPALVLLVAGERASTWTPALRHPGATGLGLVVVPLGLVAAGVVAPVDLKEGTLGTPVAGFAVAVAVSWGLLLVTDRAVRHLALTVWWARCATAFSSLAAVALPVMLSHAVLLYLLHTPHRGRLPDLLLALILPWALALLLARTPLARYLVGEHPAASRVSVVLPRRKSVRVPRQFVMPSTPRPPNPVTQIPTPRVPVDQRRIP